MEQNREPRNKSLHTRSDDLQQECQENILGKGYFFFAKWYLKKWISTCKRMKMNPYFTQYTKIKVD